MDSIILLQGSDSVAVAGIFVLLLLPIIVPAVLATVWVYKDAKRNSDDPAYLWALVALFAPLVGLLLYFLRGRHHQ